MAFRRRRPCPVAARPCRGGAARRPAGYREAFPACPGSCPDVAGAVTSRRARASPRRVSFPNPDGRRSMPNRASRRGAFDRARATARRLSRGCAPGRNAEGVIRLMFARTSLWSRLYRALRRSAVDLARKESTTWPPSRWAREEQTPMPSPVVGCSIPPRPRRGTPVGGVVRRVQNCPAASMLPTRSAPRSPANIARAPLVISRRGANACPIFQGRDKKGIRTHRTLVPLLPITKAHGDPVEAPDIERPMSCQAVATPTACRKRPARRCPQRRVQTVGGYDCVRSDGPPRWRPR